MNPPYGPAVSVVDCFFVNLFKLIVCFPKGLGGLLTEAEAPVIRVGVLFSERPDGLCPGVFGLKN
jgi:hypothetical protein